MISEFEFSFEISFFHKTYQLFFQFTVAVEKECRNAVDSQRNGKFNIFLIFNVYLADDQIIVFSGQRFQFRSQFYTRSAPGGPEIDQNRLFALAGKFGKRIFIEMQYFHNFNPYNINYNGSNL